MNRLAYVPMAPTMVRTSAADIVPQDTAQPSFLNSTAGKAALSAVGGGILGALVGSSFGRAGAGAGVGAVAGVGLWYALAHN